MNMGLNLSWDSHGLSQNCTGLDGLVSYGLAPYKSHTYLFYYANREAGVGCEGAVAAFLFANYVKARIRISV